MTATILSMPRFEKRARVLGATSFISLLFHGLILGGIVFSLPLAPIKMPEDRGISIDLETIESPAPPVEQPQDDIPPAKEPPAEPEAKVEEQPAPAPIPKPVVKKAETPRPRPVAKKTAQSKQVASANPQVASAAKAMDAKPARQAPPPTAPAPAGGSSTPRPPYPDMARKRNQEGTAHIRCQVDASGHVTDASLAKSSGYKLLDEAALKTVRKWKFRPGTNNGANVAGSVIVPVQFKLQ